MKITIVAGGTPPSKELMWDSIKDSKYTIAADRGAEALIINGFRPDYILGDFDSLKGEFLDILSNDHINIVKYDSVKDFTDTEAAFNLALDLGADEIVLLGCTGSRIDHLFPNIGLLKKALLNKVSCRIADDCNVITLTDSPMTIKGSPGQIISFFAYEEKVENFNIYGAKYELFNHTLIPFDGLTVSNEFLDKDIKITFHRGLVLIFFSRD
ncbi:MAG: thiamine diphosphokinase [Clostridiaceae bacterium]